MKTPPPTSSRRIPWFRILRIAVCIPVGAYLVLVLMLMFIETKLVYPAPKYPIGDWRPDFIPYEDVFLTTADGTQIHGWYIPHPNPRGTMMYFHGNGEHIAYNAERFEQLGDQFGLSILAIDYRGYGRSEGSPHEQGVLKDAATAHDWLLERESCEANDVVLMGRSLGGAVAIHVARDRGAKALILESTFTRLTEVAAKQFWFLPVRTLMRNRYDSVDKIADYHGPLLHSHALHDSLIPYSHAVDLHAACPSTDKQLIQFKRGGHNTLPPSEYYDEQLGPFLDRILP